MCEELASLPPSGAPEGVRGQTDEHRECPEREERWRRLQAEVRAGECREDKHGAQDRNVQPSSRLALHQPKRGDRRCYVAQSEKEHGDGDQAAEIEEQRSRERTQPLEPYPEIWSVKPRVDLC